MKKYKEVNKIIKLYICAVYGPDRKIAENKKEVNEFLSDFMDVLKKHQIIETYSIQFKDKYDGVDLIPATLFYTFDGDTVFSMELLF